MLNLECANAVRLLERSGRLTPTAAAEALVRLESLPLQRHETLDLLASIWSLRHHLSAYDAAYVALARARDCPLVTFDERLARAPGLGVEVLLPT